MHEIEKPCYNGKRGQIMNTAIVTALISGLCVAIPTIVSVIYTSNTRDAVNEERIKYLSEKIDDLTAKVEKHNQLVERMTAVERDMKTAFNRLDDLKGKK